MNFNWIIIEHQIDYGQNILHGGGGSLRKKFVSEFKWKKVATDDTEKMFAILRVEKNSSAAVCFLWTENRNIVYALSWEKNLLCNSEKNCHLKKNIAPQKWNSQELSPRKIAIPVKEENRICNISSTYSGAR